MKKGTVKLKSLNCVSNGLRLRVLVKDSQRRPMDQVWTLKRVFNLQRLRKLVSKLL